MTLSLEIFNCEWPLIKKWGHNKMNASLSMKVSNAFSWDKRRHFDLEFTEVCFEGSNWHTVSVEMKLIVYEKAQCYSTKQWIWSGTQLANVESWIHEYCSGKRDEAIALHLINILKKKIHPYFNHLSMQNPSSGPYFVKFRTYGPRRCSST